MITPIGDEIKQKKFKNEYQKAILNLMVTANALYAGNSRLLKPFELSPEQYNVLRILRGQFPNTSTVMLIQERMMNKMSNASRLVDKLEAKKLLTRRQCSADRRQVEILITEEGLNILKTLDDLFDEQDLLLNIIPEDRIKELNNQLDLIRHQIRQK